MPARARKLQSASRLPMDEVSEKAREERRLKYPQKPFDTNGVTRRAGEALVGLYLEATLGVTLSIFGLSLKAPKESDAK